METDSILVITDIDFGTKTKLTRLSKGMRQIDLASIAKVNPIDITRLEKGRYVLPSRRKRILEALGMMDDEEAGHAR